MIYYAYAIHFERLEQSDRKPAYLGPLGFIDQHFLNNQLDHMKTFGEAGVRYKNSTYPDQYCHQPVLWSRVYYPYPFEFAPPLTHEQVKWEHRQPRTFIPTSGLPISKQTNRNEVKEILLCVSERNETPLFSACPEVVVTEEQLLTAKVVGPHKTLTSVIVTKLKQIMQDQGQRYHVRKHYQTYQQIEQMLHLLVIAKSKFWTEKYRHMNDSYGHNPKSLATPLVQNESGQRCNKNTAVTTENNGRSFWCFRPHWYLHLY
ncbi:hypothetical protein PHET_11097 [Paragonimus heterotremus]|uniref:Uncharacterized protein n=1 Tax=Paragonimus heterotremus TaxID=100268 RepID=A0A8J4WCI3_9TREM|nr:hypothetical protein PHET_11097 [Paragonimus heterotremus]